MASVDTEVDGCAKSLVEGFDLVQKLNEGSRVCMDNRHDAVFLRCFRNSAESIDLHLKLSARETWRRQRPTCGCLPLWHDGLDHDEERGLQL